MQECLLGGVSTVLSNLSSQGVTYDTGGADVKAGGHMAGMSRYIVCIFLCIFACIFLRECFTCVFLVEFGCNMA